MNLILVAIASINYPNQLITNHCKKSNGIGIYNTYYAVHWKNKIIFLINKQKDFTMYFFEQMINLI